MNKLSVGLLFFLSLFTSSCKIVRGTVYPIITVPIEPISLPGEFIGGLKLAQTPIVVDGPDILSTSDLEDIEALYLSDAGLRTLTDYENSSYVYSWEEDYSPESDPLLDLDKLDTCQTGQLAVNWLEKLDVYIMRTGQESSARKIAYLRPLTATERKNGNLCGITLDPVLDKKGKQIDLKPFLPDYQIKILISGTVPVTDQEIAFGGFAKIELKAVAELPYKEED